MPEVRVELTDEDFGWLAKVSKDEGVDINVLASQILSGGILNYRIYPHGNEYYEWNDIDGRGVE